MAGDPFVPPDFSDGELEFRVENGEISIYGTAEGLKRLSEECVSLIKHPNMSHVHLGVEPGVLTSRSMNGAIAILDKEIT